MKKTFLAFIAAVVVLTALCPALAQNEKDQAIKPALLVIDVQNAYVPMMDAPPMAFRMINGVIALFRQHGLPVIRVYHTSPQWGPASDSEGFQFDPAIQVTEEDAKVIKNYGNAFKKTELDSLLRAQGVNTLFLCGLSSTGCVLATYHGGVDLDYRTFMVSQALIGPKQSLTEAVEEMLSTIDYSALSLLLDAISPREKVSNY